jgi:hypothetical protein
VLAALLLERWRTVRSRWWPPRCPGYPPCNAATSVLGSALVVFAVLLLGRKVLLARPAPVRALWPGALSAQLR